VAKKNIASTDQYVISTGARAINAECYPSDVELDCALGASRRDSGHKYEGTWRNGENTMSCLMFCVKLCPVNYSSHGPRNLRWISWNPIKKIRVLRSAVSSRYLTPWRKCFSQVLLFFQPLKNFFTIHGIGRWIIVFSNLNTGSYPEHKFGQPPTLFLFRFNIFLPYRPRYSKWPLQSNY